MSGESNTPSIPCPTCGEGWMTFRDGRLRCSNCPEYFYGGRGMCGFWANMPVDREAAFRALEAAYVS